MGGKMLQDVRQDLSDVVQVCQGKKKQTNYLRTLISDLVKGTFCNRNLIDHVRSSGHLEESANLVLLLPQASSPVAGVGTPFQPP